MKRTWLVLVLAAVGASPISAAINEVHVVTVQPDVQFHKGGTPADAWLPCEKDTVLKAGDEITCDPDGAVTLAFADNSTVVVRNTTQLKIGSFFTEGGVVRTEILLKMGEVAAQVNKSEATKSDFRIKSPTGTASVRGTKLERVSYTPTQGMSVVISEGSINLGNNTGTSTAVSKGEEGHVNHSGGVDSPQEVHRSSLASNAFAPGQTKEEVHFFQQETTPPTGSSNSSGTSVFDVVQVATQSQATQTIDKSFTFVDGNVSTELVTNNGVVGTSFGNSSRSPDGTPFLVLHTAAAPGVDGAGLAAFKTTITVAQVLDIQFDHNFVTTEDPNQFFSSDDTFVAQLRNAGNTTQLVKQSVLSTPLHPFDPRGLPAFMNLPNNTPPEVAFETGFNHFHGQFNVVPGDLELFFQVTNADDAIVQSAVSLNNIKVKTFDQANGIAALASPTDTPFGQSTVAGQSRAQALHGFAHP